MREPFEEVPAVNDFSRYRMAWFLIIVVIVIITAAVPVLLEDLNGNLLGADGTLRNVSKPDVIREQAVPRDDTSAAVIREIQTLTSTNDYHQLIGRSVNITVPVTSGANDQAFWVGQGDNQLLVELRRDARTDEQRYFGVPPTMHVADLHAGEQITIVGTIRPVPYREAMYSWGLTETDRRQLEDRPVYIEATSAQPVRSE